MDSLAEILKKKYGNISQTNTAISSNAEPVQTGLGKPDCPHCDGLGYVVPNVPPAHPTFGRAVPCTCTLEEREGKRLDSLQSISQIGPLKDRTFDTFIPDGHGLTPQKQLNLKLAYQSAKRYAENPKGWLLFKGGYGSGKTHLAAAIANYRLDQGHPVLFINTPDLLDHLRGAFSPSSPISYDKRFEQVRNTPLLVLDDLGAQSNTEWAQEKLYQIFNHRYTAKLPTIITTNMELEEIEVRIRSRLADLSLVQSVPISAPDFRRAGTHQEQSDLSTLSFHTEKLFERFDFREEELPRSQATNLRRAWETAKNFAENQEGWLVLNSTNYANGKTYLAAAIANHVQNKGEPVLFIVVPDLLDHLRASFNPSSGVRLDKRFNDVKTAPFLVLDDLGTESATAWAREKLYQLFNHRYNANLPTVITTATPVDELDPRLAARMLDGNICTFFLLQVPSYRGRARKGRKK